MTVEAAQNGRVELPEPPPQEVLDLAGIDLDALRAYNDDVCVLDFHPGTIPCPTPWWMIHGVPAGEYDRSANR